MKRILGLFLICMICLTNATAQKTSNGNPIIPGYYADPTVIKHGDKFYIYVTLDPWGGDELGLWESSDLTNWTLIPLNWPTKELCQSKTSNHNKVWAPSVIKGKDGKFHMFISVGSEIYAGVADHPAGPWRNAVSGNQPLIATQAAQGIHTIDAEAFIDDDGQAYLYWGSGLNWVNGHCMIAKLNPEMNKLDEECKDITPEQYFEGPHMIKRNGIYYLTYSEGLCTDHTYKVQYSTSKTPYGPFVFGNNNPILSSDLEKGVKGPGHHTILSYKGKHYIIYHRISLNSSKELLRQICIDRMEFSKQGDLIKVIPTNSGINLFNKRINSGALHVTTVSASTTAGELFKPGSAIDASYATLWKPMSTDTISWLKVDLGKSQSISTCETRFEYPNSAVRYKIEYSADDISWSLFADKSNNEKQGSPMVDVNKVKARYVRITLFPVTSGKTSTGIWEFVVKK